jgi:di/tricarboxylate transporter
MSAGPDGRCPFVQHPCRLGIGLVPQRDMIRAGAVLNAVCTVVLSLWGWFVLR